MTTVSVSLPVCDGCAAWALGPMEPAPTVEILFPDPVQIAGYRTQSCDHDDDNLAFWAGSDTVLSSWHYTITAMRPAD